MTRISKLAVVSAFLIAGTAFGQAPAGAPAQPAGVGWTNDSSAWQPAAPTAEAEVHGSEPWHFFGDAHSADPVRVFGSADYFLGWVKGDPLPAIVTTSPPGTPQIAAGVLNPIGTTTNTLFGGGRVNTEVRSGIRANLGAYLDPADQYAIDVGFFGLESATNGLQASSTGTPILARPFIDVTSGAGASALIAFPGLSAGQIHAVETAHNLYGFNFDVRENVFSSSWVRFDALLGYRFLRYDEHLQVQDTIVPTSGPFATGTSLATTDSFGGRNIFHGVDLGFRSEFDYRALSLEVYGKVAVGVLNRTTVIGGSEVTSVPGAAAVNNMGGMLALSSNIGRYTGHTDTAVPDVGFNLGYQITDNVRFTVGYSVLWWMNLVRPGNAIDIGLNPGLFPGNTQTAGTPNRPSFTGQYSDLWVQAVNFGLEVRY